MRDEIDRVEPTGLPDCLDVIGKPRELQARAVGRQWGEPSAAQVDPHQRARLAESGKILEVRRRSGRATRHAHQRPTGAQQMNGERLIVRPLAIRRRLDVTTASLSGSSALVASSRIRMRGSWISARAIASLWRCPPDRFGEPSSM